MPQERRDDTGAGAQPTPIPRGFQRFSPKASARSTSPRICPGWITAGKILAAVHCDPKEFNAGEGSAVVWSLSKPHPPDSALWILALDPQSKTWLSTGDIAMVSPSGIRGGRDDLPSVRLCTVRSAGLDPATGRNIRWNGYGSSRCTTESWTIWHVPSRKNIARRFMSPPARTSPSPQWLGSDANLDLALLSTEINGTPTNKPSLLVEDAAALAAAREQFAAKKGVLDKAFVDAFDNWSAAASKPGVEGRRGHLAGSRRPAPAARRKFDGGTMRNPRFVSLQGNCSTCHRRGGHRQHPFRVGEETVRCPLCRRAGRTT